MTSARNHLVTAPAPRLEWAAFEKSIPGAVAALRSLSKAVDDTGFDKRLTELIKIRVSQINGCAYCLNLHSDWARRAGVPEIQIGLVATWRDAACFNGRQRATLAWAESLTTMAAQHVSDDLHEQVASTFSENELAALTVAVAAINAWNRIAGSLRFAIPGLHAEPEAAV
jgi:AhpD family alkylhydroperoxidase